MGVKLVGAIAAVSLILFCSLVFAANNMPGLGAGFGAHTRMGEARGFNGTHPEWNGTRPALNGTHFDRNAARFGPCGCNGADSNGTLRNCANESYVGMGRLVRGDTRLHGDALPPDFNGTFPDFNGARHDCENDSREGCVGVLGEFPNASEDAAELVAARKQFRTAVAQGDFGTATELHAQYGFGGPIFGALNDSAFEKYSRIYSSSLDLWGELGLNCSEPGTCGVFGVDDAPGSARGWNPTPFRVHPHSNGANESDASDSYGGDDGEK